MRKIIKGVKVPHRKDTASCAAVPVFESSPPKTVTLLTSMHIGKPAVPCVKPGDRVFVGQLVARQDGYISSPVHSSVSGTVKKVEPVLISTGAYVPAVVIESDGQMTPDPSIAPPVIETAEQFIQAVRDSGIVGLGGAGFPTYVKFDVKDYSKIRDVIVNGAECEPYITSDTRTMVDRARDIGEGIDLLEKYLGIKSFVIGIEDNKPQAAEAMKKIAAARSGVRVRMLPSGYPQGGEKVLVYNTVGRVIPAGKLPLDVGAVVVNCTTLAAIAEYVRTGMPLVSKVVTVAGAAVKEPKNALVPIGTSFADVFEACGGLVCEPAKVLYGGPMMGIAVPDLNVPVLKSTNAILAFDKKEAAYYEPGPCIRCGRCVQHCPMSLNPTAIANAYEHGDGAEAERLQAGICMECGSCAYICPAKRPLVQEIKMAKVLMRQHQAKAAAEKKQKEAV